jgi:hypothetical protein
MAAVIFMAASVNIIKMYLSQRGVGDRYKVRRTPAYQN